MSSRLARAVTYPNYLSRKQTLKNPKKTNGWSNLRPMRGSPSLSLPGWPGTREWTAQRPRIKPNMTEKIKAHAMITNDILLYSYSGA